MKLGFTGTRKGMTLSQRREFHTLLLNKETEITEFHHGDCIGADAEAHRIVQRVLPKVKIVIHPPLDSNNRAFCLLRSEKDTASEPKDYIERNHDIVNSIDVLFAAPFTNDEILRSGTWATIRYAKRIERRIEIAYR